MTLMVPDFHVRMWRGWWWRGLQLVKKAAKIDTAVGGGFFTSENHLIFLMRHHDIIQLPKWKN